jgi:hypothetical protein
MKNPLRGRVRSAEKSAKGKGPPEEDLNQGLGIIFAMTSRWIPWLIAGGLALIAGVLAVQAWSATRGAAVVLEWSTASEFDTAGYHLYRGEAPEGPFVRINEHLIPAAPDALLGGEYVYTDTHVAPGGRYYYQLEDVENNGATSRHGPLAVRASLPGVPEAALALVCLAFAAGTLWRNRDRREEAR